MLCREQGLSLDYWLAKAESYYNKRIMETVKEQEKGSEIKRKAVKSRGDWREKQPKA